MTRVAATLLLASSAFVVVSAQFGSSKQKASGGQEASGDSEGSGSPLLPYHPPLPSFSVQPWEMAPVGGGLPPEPLVYHSNAQKQPPSIQAGMYSPMAAAHAYPAASSPYFPYTPPSQQPRALPGPFNQLPFQTPEVTGNGAYLPHTYVPGALYPGGFGAPTQGNGNNLAGSKQPDEKTTDLPPGTNNGAAGPGNANADAGADLSKSSASLLEVADALRTRGRLSAYHGKRKAQLRTLLRHQPQ